MENRTIYPSVSWFTPVLSSPNAIQRRTTFNNDEVIRIVMVGKTGAGKSATGNTIVGEKVFKSHFSAKSLTKNCSKAFGEVDGEKIAVFDTPGLFGTNNDEKKTTEEVVQSISLASPGPHIFLIVIKLGRFTEEEKQTVQKIQKIFGEDSNKYCMVLFTYGDELTDTIEEFLRESQELQELVAKCNGQYHVFNNKVKDRSQVRELLKKIRKITEKNGGSHYTTEMFQKAEKAIEEEKQRILKKKEEEMCKQREELKKKIKEKYEEQMKEVKDDLKKQNELRAARERELEEKIRQLKERREEKAREEAEKISSILALIEEIAREYLQQTLHNLKRRTKFYHS